MPNRHTNTNEYRFGYNGMEKDPEMKGDGNSYTTEFRQYDPRLGRWLSLDPLMQLFPSLSPYCAFDNNPILKTDIYGLSPDGDPIIRTGDQNSETEKSFRRETVQGLIRSGKDGHVTIIYKNVNGGDITMTYTFYSAENRAEENWSHAGQKTAYSSGVSQKFKMYVDLAKETPKTPESSETEAGSEPEPPTDKVVKDDKGKTTIKDPKPPGPTGGGDDHKKDDEKPKDPPPPPCIKDVNTPFIADRAQFKSADQIAFAKQVKLVAKYLSEYPTETFTLHIYSSVEESDYTKRLNWDRFLYAKRVMEAYYPKTNFSNLQYKSHYNDTFHIEILGKGCD